MEILIGKYISYTRGTCSIIESDIDSDSVMRQINYIAFVVSDTEESNR